MAYRRKHGERKPKLKPELEKPPQQAIFGGGRGLRCFTDDLLINKLETLREEPRKLINFERNTTLGEQKYS